MTLATPRAALVTCPALPLLFGEEREFAPMLRARGVEASVVSWDDPAADWKAFDAILIRSTWDYFTRFEEFKAWLARLEAMGAKLHPSASLVRWNADKRYLRDLEGKGVRIVPTAFLEPGAKVSLAALLRERGWDRAIVKPAVSGGAFRTYRVDVREAEANQARLDEILAVTCAMVQPYMPEIETDGEWSIVFYEGEYSHAVVKLPSKGDFRIQPEFGGTFTQVTPEAALLGQARAVLDASPERPPYARIDGIRRGGEFVLMEAELIEPYLYGAGAPGASERYVQLVEKLARADA